MHFPGGQRPLASIDDFSILFESHSREVLRFFARRILDPELAMDLTAETFAQALISRRRFRGSTPEEAQAWLFGIARNQLGSFLRKGIAERRAMKKLGIESPELTQEAHDRVIELAGIARQRVALTAALETLSESQRDALQLRVVDELPYADVAERLGISSQTARARVSRALAALALVIDVPPTEEGAS